MTSAHITPSDRRRRHFASAAATAFGSVGSLIIALTLSAAIVGISGFSVVDTTKAILEGSFGSSDAIGATLQSAIPLTLVALGFTIAFRAREINIGLEAQAIAGGIAAVTVAVALPDLIPGLARFSAVAAAAISGALVAGVAVFLQIRRGVNLVISTFLSNFIMALLLSWLVRGPLQAAESQLGISEAVPTSVSWPHFGTSPLSYDILLIPLLITFVAGFERFTRPGLVAGVVGSNPEFALYSGVPVNRYRAGGVLVSGALAGLAGASIVLAPPSFALVDDFTGEVGYIGIAAALLARGSFVACFGAGALIAALQQGTAFAQVAVGVPGSMAGVLQGTVILVVGALGYWLSLRARRAFRNRRDIGAVPSEAASPVGVSA